MDESPILQPPQTNNSLTFFSKNKRLFIIISVLAVLLILIPISMIIYTKYIKTTQSPAKTNQSIPARIPNVFYPVKPDITGRDIYYIANGAKGAVPYSGSGVQFFPEGSKYTKDNGEAILTVASSSAFTNYIVGSFENWEDIPNSADKYLILQDLAGIRNEKGELTTIPKIRIGFSVKDGTAFGIEDLSSIIPKVLDVNLGTKIYKAGLIESLAEDFNKLIKLGDVIAVTLIPDFSTKKDLLDKNNNKVASWILIRRFDVKIQIEKELGKTLNLQ